MTTTTIPFRTAVAVAAACVACAALAQVATAPSTVKAPVTNATISGVTAPMVVAVSYPAPGKSPPTAATSFPAVAWSFFTGDSALTPAVPGRATRSSLDVTVAISSASPAPVIPLRTALTSLTLTMYKAGVVTAIVSLSQPVLESTSFPPGDTGPREQLQFSYTQATTTYSR